MLPPHRFDAAAIFPLAPDTMKTLSILPFAVSILLSSAVAKAADAPANHGRVVATVTKTVQIFSTLENAWLDAVEKRDAGALKKIMADDFELRTAAAPG